MNFLVSKSKSRSFFYQLGSQQRHNGELLDQIYECNEQQLHKQDNQKLSNDQERVDDCIISQKVFWWITMEMEDE